MNDNLTLTQNLNPQVITASESHSDIPNIGINYGDFNRLVRESPQVTVPPMWKDYLTRGYAVNRLGVDTRTVSDSSHESTLRPTWDAYFLGIASAVAARADCSRRKVGAVIVRNHRIVSTGYNGSPPGGKSCLKGECPRGLSSVEPLSSYDTGPGSCIALHAEANALLYASRDDREGSTLYITCEPCDGCLRLIRGSGLKAYVYTYGEPSSLNYMSVPL